MLVEVRYSLWATMTVEGTWPDHHHVWEKDTLDLQPPDMRVVVQLTLVGLRKVGYLAKPGMEGTDHPERRLKDAEGIVS